MGGKNSGTGENAHKYEKEQSGNKKGAPKKENTLSYWIRKIGDEKDPKSKVLNKIALARKAWELALKGDQAFSRLIMDREAPARNINENINKKDGEPDDTFEFIRSDLLRTKQYVQPWYKPATYHKEIAAALQDKSIKKLIITLPPQHGKTELACRTFPAWYLANNPTEYIIASSYNQEFSNTQSVKCRDFFLDDKFQRLFNYEYALHPDQQTKHEWMLKKHKGGIIFSGVGGTITGNSADVLLLDDLTKDYEDASSKLKQETIWNWYLSVVSSRLQSEHSRIIIISTRWTKNDLIGKLLKKEEDEETLEEDKFKILHYPAILDVDGEDFEKGRPLWPEKKSMKFLMARVKDSIAVFKTMWQGNPRDLEGRVINPEWIQIENDVKKLGKLMLSCRGWDFGYTKTGDYTCGAKIDLYANNEIITPILDDVVIFREEPTDTKQKIIEIAEQDGKDVLIGLEGGGTQIAMSRDLKRRKELLDYKVYERTPKGDKISRALPWILKIEDGHFRLKLAKWNKFVIDSMKEFEENCEHDDIEDAITIAWKTLFGGKDNA